MAALAWIALLAGCGSPPADNGGGSLRAILGAEAGSAAEFAKADRAIQFSFPRDHGSHPDYRSEWWYVTAVLATAAGREFGVQFTLFRQGMEPSSRDVSSAAGVAAWRTGQVYLGHVAVSDVANRRHVEAERLARGHPSLAGVEAAPFAAWIEDWRLASTGDGFWPLRLQASADGFAIDLALAGTKAIVPQGDGGLSRKGPDNASYYYSIPRIQAVGSLDMNGATYHVAGNAWLDREWSTGVLAPEYAGWDWFALHLDDGRDFMLYRLRRIDGQADDYDAGAVVDDAGRATILDADDFALTVAKRWRGWPVAWRLALSGERFLVRAAFEDQVMNTSVRYWEGVAFVEGRDGQRLGAGYMELTGY